MAELDLVGMMDSDDDGSKSVLWQWVSGMGSRLTAEDTEKLIAATIPDLTFAEAYAKTGRQVRLQWRPLSRISVPGCSMPCLHPTCICGPPRWPPAPFPVCSLRDVAGQK